MAATNFGFARPIAFGKLEKGMLVVAAPADGQRYFGVVTKIHHDMILLVLASLDGDVPGTLDIGYVVDDLWQIAGTLEIEPTEPAFSPSQRRASTPTFAIDNDGNIAGVVYHVAMGMKEQFLIDLSTGEHLQRPEKIAYFKGAKFYIRQEGRKERFECPVLTPDQ